MGDQQGSFDLAPVVEGPGRQPKKVTAPDRLRLGFKGWRGRAEVHRSWRDDPDIGLEEERTKIAIELLLTSELMYREYTHHAHTWRVDQKRPLEERLQRERAEAERRELERLVALQQARVDRPLKDAAALRLARAIRAYVGEVRTENERTGNVVPIEEVESWANWALQQADAIDPVRSGAFLASELR